MTAMPPLRDIINDTPVDAVDVDYNFGVLEGHIASELINRDGSVAMAGPLSLPGPPTAPQHATTKAYVDSNVIPVGTIWEFAGMVAPAGWVFCDGASKSTTDPAYVALFDVIGYRHGGAGANFNLPDRRARVPVGFWAGDAIAGTLGAKGGRRDASLVGHTHLQNAHSHGGSTQTVDTNHLHDLQNHSHYNEHTHDSGVRYGYDLIGANNVGATNAVYPGLGNATLIMQPIRPTAICNAQVDGPNHVSTGSMIERDYTDGPTINNTGWMDRTNVHGHGINAESPAIATAGETPTNLNYPLYEVVNYMIRIG